MFQVYSLIKLLNITVTAKKLDFLTDEKVPQLFWPLEMPIQPPYRHIQSLANNQSSPGLFYAIIKVKSFFLNFLR